MSRSSSISSRLIGGGQTAADIAAIKAKLESQQAELTTLKTSGTGVNQDALALSLKPLEDKITDAKNIAISNDNKISNLENAVPSRDELTLAVADLPKKADKTAVDSLTTTVSGINVAVGENVAAINAEIAALKARLDAIEAML